MSDDIVADLADVPVDAALERKLRAHRMATDPREMRAQTSVALLRASDALTDLHIAHEAGAPLSIELLRQLSNQAATLFALALADAR